MVLRTLADDIDTTSATVPPMMAASFNGKYISEGMESGDWDVCKAKGKIMDEDFKLPILVF